jgi:uncharacterized protein (DUF433 family)
MATSVSHTEEPWRQRLYLPNYQIGEAARYAGISAQTVAAWHKEGARESVTLSKKEQRAALSYMQLIEVAVVAAFRKAGIPLRRIRKAREFVAKSLRSEYPFSEYRFKTDGRRLWVDYEQVEGESGRGKLMGADNYGQLAWSDIIGRLKEFEYDGEGIVVSWHVDGERSPITIDPRISFGAPCVGGTPTWVIKGRWNAGESIADIAEDFGIKKLDVRRALKFEDIVPDLKRKKKWVH